jgi:hypothetical protein
MKDTINLAIIKYCYLDMVVMEYWICNAYKECTTIVYSF